MTDTARQELKFLQSLFDLVTIKPNTNRNETALGVFKKSALDLVELGQISKNSLDLFLSEYDLTSQIKEAIKIRDEAEKKIRELEAKKKEIVQAKEKTKPIVTPIGDGCGGGIVRRSSC